MAKKQDRNQFTFVESEQTEGLIDRIDELAAKDGRKRNNWVGWKLSKVVEQEEKNNQE